MGICCSKPQISNRVKPKTRSIAVMTENHHPPSQKIPNHSPVLNQPSKPFIIRKKRNSGIKEQPKNFKNEKKFKISEKKPKKINPELNFKENQNEYKFPKIKKHTRTNTSLIRKKEYRNEMGTFHVEENQEDPFSKNVLIIPHKRKTCNSQNSQDPHRRLSKESLYQKIFKKNQSPTLLSDMSPVMKRYSLASKHNRKMSRISQNTDNLIIAGRRRKFTISEIKKKRGISEKLLEARKKQNRVSKPLKFKIESVKSNQRSKCSSGNKQSIEDQLRLGRKQSEFSKITLKKVSGNAGFENFEDDGKKLILQKNRTKKELSTPQVGFRLRRGRSQSEHQGQSQNFFFKGKRYSNLADGKKLQNKFQRNGGNKAKSSFYIQGNQNLKMKENMEKKARNCAVLAEDPADLTDSSSESDSEHEWRRHRKYSIAEKYENNLKKVAESRANDSRLHKVDEEEDNLEAAKKINLGVSGERGSLLSRGGEKGYMEMKLFFEKERKLKTSSFSPKKKYFMSEKKKKKTIGYFESPNVVLKKRVREGEGDGVSNKADSEYEEIFGDQEFRFPGNINLGK